MCGGENQEWSSTADIGLDNEETNQIMSQGIRDLPCGRRRGGGAYSSCFATVVVAERRLSSSDGSRENLHVEEESELAIGQEGRDKDGPEGAVQTDGPDSETSVV